MQNFSENVQIAKILGRFENTHQKSPRGKKEGFILDIGQKPAVVSLNNNMLLNKDIFIFIENMLKIIIIRSFYVFASKFPFRYGITYFFSL